MRHARLMNTRRFLCLYMGASLEKAPAWRGRLVVMTL